MTPKLIRIAPLLGCLGALGPLAIDMYLPALPAIAADLRVDQGGIQLSLMAFFAGLMLGQLFYGPLSDRTGRKPMIYLGLALFVVGALGSALSATAGQLVGWRFLQGVGGSIGMVIGLAVVRDLYTGRTAARLIALMMAVQGVAPVVAPLLGAFFLSRLSWRALFAIQALLAVTCGALVCLLLPETRAAELRAAARPAAALRDYLHLTTSRRFIPYALTLAVAQGGFFAYLAGSSFVFISLHDLSPGAYSLVFALNALGLMAGAQAAPRLMGWFRSQSIVRTALAVYAVTAVVLAGLDAAGGVDVTTLTCLLFVIVTSMSFVMPLCGAMAMDAYGAIPGTAAALMGALQFGAGTLVSLTIGLAADGTAGPMLAAIAGCGLISCLIAFAAFPARQVLLQQEDIES